MTDAVNIWRLLLVTKIIYFQRLNASNSVVQNSAGITARDRFEPSGPTTLNEAGRA